MDNENLEQDKILHELHLLEKKIKQGRLSAESAYLLFTFLNNSRTIEEVKKIIQKVKTPWFLLEIQKSEFVFAHNLLKLLTQLDKYKYVDFLTSLYNKRFFEETLARELKGAGRYGLPLALIIWDIDDFKKINDSYGHKVGDVVLQSVARAIKASLRLNDYACRIGGEEFGVILPKVTYEEACWVAQRILLTVRELKIKVNQDIIQTTISGGGVVCAGVGSIDNDVLFKIADDNLYKAKRSGKNKFYITPYYLKKDVEDVAVNQEEKMMLFSS